MGAAASAVRTGELLDGRYRLGRHLGDDRLAEHYEAHDVAEDRPVRVRLMRPELVLRRDAQESFLALAKHLLARPVPHLARVLSVGADSTGVPFVVEQSSGGKSLSALLRALPSGFSVDDGAAVIAQTVDAIAHLHLAAVAHRHVDPSHMMVSPQGDRPLVCLGQCVGANEPSVHPAYQAPEMRAGRDHDLIAADVFALGVLMHHAWTGQTPRAGDDFDTLERRMPGLPRPVLLTMVEALASDAAVRIPDAASLWMRLEGPLSELSRSTSAAADEGAPSSRGASGLRRRSVPPAPAQDDVQPGQRDTLPVPPQDPDAEFAAADDEAAAVTDGGALRPSLLDGLSPDMSLDETRAAGDGGQASATAPVRSLPPPAHGSLPAGAADDDSTSSAADGLPAIASVPPEATAAAFSGDASAEPAGADTPSDFGESGDDAQEPASAVADADEETGGAPEPVGAGVAAAFASLAPEAEIPSDRLRSSNAPDKASSDAPRRRRDRRGGAVLAAGAGDAMAEALTRRDSRRPSANDGKSPRSRRREREERERKAAALTDAQMARLTAMRAREGERRWLRYVELLVLLLFLPALYKAVPWLVEPGLPSAREVLGDQLKVPAIALAATAVAVHVRALAYNAKAKLLMLKPLIYASTVVTLSVSALVAVEVVLSGAPDATAGMAAGHGSGGVFGRAARLVLPAATSVYLFLGMFFGLYKGIGRLGRSVPMAVATWALAALGGASAYGIASATFLRPQALGEMANDQESARKIMDGFRGQAPVDVEAVEGGDMTLEQRTTSGDGIEDMKSIDKAHEERKKTAAAYKDLEDSMLKLSP